ncbi:MAG: ATP-binding protein [Acholeplasmatales bacterium]|nr:ATP-binding protein [Acholeplasmatales bacterium]
MISRTIYKEILDTISNKAVTVITGARQVGKTTLCSWIEKELKFNYVSLADPIIRNAAKNDPSEFLSLNPFPLIIDEIQKAPELFDYLEGIVDKEIKKGNKKGLYVLTGSQAYKLMKGVNESMSGRVGLVSMSPLSLSEINGKEENPFCVDIKRINCRINDYSIETRKMYDYITRGFYPELYDNPSLKASVFYADYVETYIERDVTDFITLKDKQKFINLMTILASLTGQELIYDNLAKIIGVDVKTIQSWVSVLIAGNIIYLLQPYNEESMVKQVTKRSKIYFCDTGLACYLARVNTTDALISSYLKGHMVETFIINEIIKSYKNNRVDKESSFYYYRNSNQEEIDLIINRDGKLTLLECKSGEEYSASDVSSFDNLEKTKLKIDNNAIICTTKTIYSIKKGVYVIPFTAI